MKYNKKAIDKLSAARCQLVIHFPFFGYLGYNFTFVESKSAGGQGTCAVDAKGNFYYNAEFINGLELVEVMFVFCHEIMHIVQGCHARFPKGGNFQLWNLASDFAVNALIRDSKLPTDPQNCKVLWKVFPEELYQKVKGKSSEENYINLMKNELEICGVSQCGEDTDREGDDPGPDAKNGGNASDPRNGLGCASGSVMQDLQNNARARQEWSKKIIAADDIAKARDKGRGTRPGWLDDFITRITKPSVTWKDKLRRAAVSRFRGRFTWSRPGRRSLAIGMRLQSRKPSPRCATLVIDTSGSISERDIHQFLSEAVEIMRQCKAPKIHIYFHDTECYHDEEFNPLTKNKIKIQRGGTSHIPVLTKVHEDGNDKGIVICFTDLMSEFPDPELLRCPVVWAVTQRYENHQHPWGTKVVVRNT